jgi:hypothetical protein
MSMEFPLCRMQLPEFNTIWLILKPLVPSVLIFTVHGMFSESFHIILLCSSVTIIILLWLHVCIVRGWPGTYINVWIFLHLFWTRMFSGGTPLTNLIGPFTFTTRDSVFTFCTYQVSYYHQGIQYHATDLCWIGWHLEPPGSPGWVGHRSTFSLLPFSQYKHQYWHHMQKQQQQQQR